MFTVKTHVCKQMCVSIEDAVMHGVVCSEILNHRNLSVLERRVSTKRDPFLIEVAIGLPLKGLMGPQRVDGPRGG